MLFKNLKVWHDVVPRSGPENMAVDQWLIENVGDVPVLRIYGWEGDWVSLGYFQSLAEARGIFGDGPDYVRRWTGGGIVDHRGDVTYTLAIPRSEELATSRGNESYCAIHRQISQCLGEGGIACQLTEIDSENDSAACFENPVAFDLLDGTGAKLAGAGQRRTRWGILHQGSVAAAAGSLDGFASFLCDQSEGDTLDEEPKWREMSAKYRSEDWHSRVL